MEEQEENQQQISIESFELLKHIPEPTMKVLFDLYNDYIKMFSRVRFSSVGVLAVIGISKLIFGGKSYTRTEYDNIMTGTLTLASILVICSITFGIMTAMRSKKLKKELKEIVNKHKFTNTEFLLEFNALLQHFFGGPGIKKL